MKAFLYTCLGLAALLTGPRLGAAQGLTNLNLDSWTTRGTVEKPVNWFTTDETFAFLTYQPTGTYNFGTVTKTTDKHGGTYAAKLTTTPVTVQGQMALFPGILQFGAKTGILSDPLLGFPGGGAPLAAKPTAMQYYYKFSGPVADSAFAFTYLTNTTSAGTTVLAYGYKFLAVAANYTLDTVPITYSTQNTSTPDSVHIVFLSGLADVITSGASLYVDDVTFTGVALATRADATVQDLLTVSPNPSPGGRFVLNSPARPALAAAPLRVYDLTGRTVLSQAAQAVPSGQRELDLSALKAGIYLLRIDARDGTIVRPLTVQ